jgi:hypothetical protein
VPITRLDCLTFHTTLHAALSADSEYDVLVRHEVQVHPQHATVAWQVDLDLQGATACEIRARYRLQFEEVAEPQWTALDATWPYLRQQAGVFLADHGLLHFLPVELPLALPDRQRDQGPEVAPTVGRESGGSQAVTSPVLKRTLPLTRRLTTILNIQKTLHRIVEGEGTWLLGAVQLYGALLGATRSRPKGARLEWHSRNDALQAQFFENVSGTSLSEFLALDRSDQRTLLSAAREIVATLMDDVLSRQSDMRDGELMDSYHDDLNELFDSTLDTGEEDLPALAAAPLAEAGHAERDPVLDQLYQYVMAPFAELRQPIPLKGPPLVEHIPLLNGEPISMTTATTYTGEGRLDIVAVTMVVTDSEYLFEDPDPLADDIPLTIPTMYRLRHLHLDQTQTPSLLFVTDLNLDADVASVHSDQFEEMYTEEQLARWGRARELAERPWPPEGEALSPQDLEWLENPGTPQELGAWLLQQGPDTLTAAQWQDILRVEELDLDTLVRKVRLPLSVLAALAEHPEPELRREVAEQDGLPEALLEQFWNDTDEVRQGLAMNPALPEQLQRRLAHVDSIDVRSALAFNPHLMPELLEFLADDPYYPIRTNVAGNPATSDSILKRLINDSHEWVRDEAEKALSARQTAP